MVVMWMWMQGIVLSMLYHGGEKQETKRANTSPRRCGRAQIRSYMQMYAFALSTSSSVVSRTTVSLMYAQRRGCVLALCVDAELGCGAPSAGAASAGDVRDGGSAVYAT